MSALGAPAQGSRPFSSATSGRSELLALRAGARAPRGCHTLWSLHGSGHKLPKADTAPRDLGPLGVWTGWSGEKELPHCPPHLWAFLP